MELSEVLDYFTIDPKLGTIKWRKRSSNRITIGDDAGSVNAQGYIVIGLHGIDYRAHRLIWSYCHGEIPKGMEIDHINVNKIDNRIENLRMTSHIKNTYNVPLTKRNTSGFKGVSWNKERNLWEAYIDAQGKRRRLGRFASLEDAVEIVRINRELLHGEYANYG